MSPDVGSDRSENRWTSPDVAQCRWALAPRLAPRDLVSTAKVRTISAACQPMRGRIEALYLYMLMRGSVSLFILILELPGIRLDHGRRVGLGHGEAVGS